MTNERKTLREKLAHAFSVKPEGDLTEDDHALLDRVARKVVERRMTAPVILALQSVLPLGFLGSQALIALKPFAELAIPGDKYDQFTRIIERREGLQLLMEKIERFEAETKIGRVDDVL